MDKAAAEPSLPLTVQARSADVRRQVSPPKPLLRGWLHLVWFEASLVLGTLTLARAHGAVRIAALAIFAVSVSAMFRVSALYHRGDWTETWRRRLQRVDHAMIFLLIAGTATPAFLLATRGVFRISCLIVVWALTLTAGGLHTGWVGGLALPGVWLHSGVAAGALMLAGGLLYTAGALSYRRRRPDPYPSVFGYHEVFHVFVCAAATCQYIAIAWFIA